MRIQELLSKVSLSVKDRGNRYALLCPYHNDRRIGNAWIYKDTGIFICMSCGAKRSAYSFFKEQGVPHKEILDVIGNKVFSHKEYHRAQNVRYIKPEGRAELTPYLTARGWTKDDISFFDVMQGQGVLITPVDKKTMEYRKSVGESSRVWYSNNDYGIFHTKGLDTSKDLWMCEGIMGLARLRRHNQNCTATIGSKIRISLQIDLCLFQKRKILVLDDDIAGWNFLEKLSRSIPKLYGVVLRSEDTDENYNQELRQADPIPAARLLSYKQSTSTASCLPINTKPLKIKSA